MTAEKAYEILTTTSAYVECAHCENLCEDCDFYKAQDLAVKALEKQMPSPSERCGEESVADFEVFFGKSIEYAEECSCCKLPAKVVFNDGDFFELNYCHNCGQKMKLR